MIAGRDAVRHGEAKNSWLTGTASWNFVLISQFILGLKPDWDGLRVDPCVPASWKEFTVRRTFRGSRYEIRIRNPAGVEKGVARLSLDGKTLEGNLIPASAAAGDHMVVVEMG
jgi:cellobiose phosphorylase